MAETRFQTVMDNLPIKEIMRKRREQYMLNMRFRNGNVPMNHVHLIQDRVINHMVENNYS